MGGVTDYKAMPDAIRTGQDAAGTLDHVRWPDLVGHRECVQSDTPISEVHRQFEATGHAFFGVVDNGVLVGLVSRTRLGNLLGSRYGFSLYSRKPIGEIASHHPFFIAHDAPLIQVLETTMARTDAAFYEDVPLVDENHLYLGMVLVPTLVGLQSKLLTEKIGQLEASRTAMAERNRTLTAMAARLNQSNEEIARARDAALSAAKAKSTFLANVSHEIRTPMNGVIGFLNLLVDTGLETDQLEFAQTARDSAESLLELINELLDLSKIEAGRLDLEEHPCDLRKLVTDIVALHRMRAADKGVDVSLDIAHFPTGMVRTDQVRFRQVVVNLVGNAIKFTSEGSVAIKLAVRHGSGSPMIVVEVADTGIGITAEVIPKLFIPFSQADTSTTRRFGGTGLGLAISKQLVELMGGEIGVTSEVDRGSVFWFTLPYHPEAPAPTPPPQARPASGVVYHHRVLVAEDNAINRRLAERLLGGIGCLVECAINGAEAVTAMQSKYYDLVFMDCQMPVMDGYEAVQNMRRWELENATARRLPIYALTASSDAG